MVVGFFLLNPLMSFNTLISLTQFNPDDEFKSKFMDVLINDGFILTEFASLPTAVFHDDKLVYDCE
ncbi:MAG: hypothetical protein BWY27_00547 [Bacteroidetes bacterium ADurb.Bin234]|nr:MAG: hypothetical protein BWY27_00547 [Bacteroidetes bacterium ADurb.Bin234]